MTPPLSPAARIARPEAALFVSDMHLHDAEPALTAQAVFIPEPAAPSGTFVDNLRPVPLADGSFMLEFRSLASRNYFVQYTSSLQGWRTVVPPVAGTGSSVQWIDNGPPKTESLPSQTSSRIYRVLLAP